MMAVLVNYGEPYGLGWESWMAGDKITDCPWRAGTATHGAWTRGWTEAKEHYIRRSNIDRMSAPAPGQEGGE